MSKEVLFIEAEHGKDEWPAGERPDAVRRLLRKRPIVGVDSALGNPWALWLGKRMINSNMLSATPDPNGDYDQRQKFRLGTQIDEYKVAVSRHGTKQEQNDCAACHPEADPIVWHAIALAGLKRVVHHPSIPSFTTNLHRNYVIFDLGPDSPLTSDALYEVVQQLQTDVQLPPSQLLKYEGERFAFAGDIPMEQAEALRLPPEMTPFSTYEPAIAAQLGFGDVPLLALSASTELYGRHTGIYSECVVPWSYVA
jgi:hypothetical protein